MYASGVDGMVGGVENACGMPCDTFGQTRNVDPLKMTSSYWTVPASEVGRFANNYVIMGDARTPFDPAATSVYLQKPSFPYGGAGLVMSARDYDRFLHMPQDGGEIGRASCRERVCQDG